MGLNRPLTSALLPYILVLKLLLVRPCIEMGVADIVYYIFRVASVVALHFESLVCGGVEGNFTRFIYLFHMFYIV